jgi:hypothetical protein
MLLICLESNEGNLEVARPAQFVHDLHEIAVGDRLIRTQKYSFLFVAPVINLYINK